MRVGGCDPSLTGCALVAHVDGELREHEFKSKNLGDTVEARNARYETILRPLREAVIAAKLDLLVIEGHPVGAKNGKAFDRAELRGQLQLVLGKHVGAWVELNPIHLKQYVTGKGNADWDEMVRCVHERWGRRFASDNTCDAYALWRFGLELVPLIGTGHPQQAVERLLAREKRARVDRERVRNNQLFLGGR